MNLLAMETEAQAKPMELESEFNINRMHYLSILLFFW